MVLESKFFYCQCASCDYARFSLVCERPIRKFNRLEVRKKFRDLFFTKLAKRVFRIAFCSHLLPQFPVIPPSAAPQAGGSLVPDGRARYHSRR
nr:MAG TPA: hypothetical protein [Caudoviricetes sp.]